jgi:hypothetical protein
MTVAKETAPQFGDFVIVQSDVVARDRAARKAAQDDFRSISSITLAHIVDSCHAVSLCLVGVSPPLKAISLSVI